jgi:hypothetical protein
MKEDSERRSGTHYKFQESYIWDGAQRPDPGRPIVKRKAKTEARARKSLPLNDLGRSWILISEE